MKLRGGEPAHGPRSHPERRAQPAAELFSPEIHSATLRMTRAKKAPQAGSRGPEFSSKINHMM